MLFAILQYQFQKKKPAREVIHPVYGLLTGEGTTWSGKVDAEGQKFFFSLDGTELEPGHACLARLVCILQDLDKLEKTALDYLRANEAELARAPLRIYSVPLTGADASDLFRLEFTVAPGNAELVWRVEFDAGRPVSRGFDDSPAFFFPTAPAPPS